MVGVSSAARIELGTPLTAHGGCSLSSCDCELRGSCSRRNETRPAYGTYHKAIIRSDPFCRRSSLADSRRAASRGSTHADADIDPSNRAPMLAARLTLAVARRCEFLLDCRPSRRRTITSLARVYRSWNGSPPEALLFPPVQISRRFDQGTVLAFVQVPNRLRLQGVAGAIEYSGGEILPKRKCSKPIFPGKSARWPRSHASCVW